MQARLDSPASLATFGLARSVRRRAWAVLLAVAVGLASFMHVAHSHDADGPTQLTQGICTFCTVFDRGGGAPPPADAVLLAVAPTATAPTVDDVEAPADSTVRSPCNPRAPPAIQA
jgi:peptidoglycan/LPS O-acetylase OafA/YrhL